MVVELGALSFAKDDEGAALVRRAAAGETAAFDELVRRHWHELVRLARVVLASDLEAEDLAQETLVHAWRRLAELREPASFLPWLRRSLVRRGVRLVRQRRRRQTARLEAADQPVAVGLGPTEGLQVETLLAALTPRQRTTVFLVEVEGLTTAEAAQRLGTSAATLRVHLYLARRRLRALLAGESP
jgi:RNA polymerase sigma-70 factor, ECF subfamily